MDPMGKCSNAFFSETTNMIKGLNLPHFDLILIPVYQPLPGMEFIFSSVVVFTTSKGVN
jgi:hypothetical protein